VAITPDGSRAYVTHDTSPGKVSVIDLATKAVIEEIPVGAYLRGIAITPDGGHAYVVDSSRQLVSVIAIDKAPTLDGTPPTGAVNTPYTHTFTVTGQPAPTVTVTGGTLPDGLELSAAGVLSGTPTTAGSFTFSVTASNGFGTAAVLADVTIEVTQTPPPATGLLGSLENFGS
ncbi:YncE family protein, partial [Rhodococcus globerulus]|uniref:YncE family protein n=1 Tax=Rhodococcus globerulus TaxID=33008 RepID=UPI001F3E373A